MSSDVPTDLVWVDHEESVAAHWVKRWLDRCEPDENGCLIWPGAKSDRGYALVAMVGADGKRRLRKLHRIAYAYEHGPIAAGLVIDHVRHAGCRSRACCNPAHLEAVTQAENMRRGAHARKTHCPAGHAYDDANTYVYDGRRYCRACHQVHVRRSDRKRRSS